jgi:hypothetical protein
VIPRKVVNEHKYSVDSIFSLHDYLILDNNACIAYQVFTKKPSDFRYVNYFVNAKEAFETLNKKYKSSLKSKKTTLNNLPKQISELEAKIKENEDILNTL